MEHPIEDVARDPQAAAERMAMLPQVAGVSIAGIFGGRIELGAAGVADVETGEPTTTATRFRPGSITKLLTAALVMQCVEDGLVSLDDPVDDHDGVLVRHLISHSSGIDAGDLFVDTGEGGDALDRYAELLLDAQRLFPPGATFSYNNAGFVLAGRLVARVRGEPFEDVARARLGMEDAAFIPGKVDDPRTARGHASRTPLPRVTDNPVCSKGLAPAGGTLTATAEDLARFVRANLASPGTAVMRELHAVAPGGVPQMLGSGFGWMVWRNPQFASVRIGGAYPSHSGIIAADIESGSAIVVLTNSDQGVHVVQAMLDASGALAQDTPPAPDDLGAYAGSYESHLLRLDVSVTDGGLRVMLNGGMPGMVTPRDRTTFTSPVGPLAFFDFDAQGVPNLVRGQMRVCRRVSG